MKVPFGLWFEPPDTAAALRELQAQAVTDAVIALYEVGGLEQFVREYQESRGVCLLHSEHVDGCVGCAARAAAAKKEGPGT